MAKKLDITGEKYNRLSALEAVGRDKHGKIQWRFLCDCGKIVVTPASQVKSGKTKSCGCYHRDNLKRRNTSHGRSRTPEYTSWLDMNKRCLNPNSTYYENYGGRGITVCEEWAEFENFLRDMGPRPKGTSLDRIDNSKGYHPGNCRWATREEQANNQRTNIRVEYQGKTLTLKQWSRELQLSYKKLYRQFVTNQLPFEEALEKVRKQVRQQEN